MCNNFPNIKVVEGNAFSVLVPLKVRTFESCSPIDEDIDPTQLSNVVFKFGGVSYTPIVDERGVSAVLPATLARGTYDIVLTANYGDNPIRAAYESAITIVPWNSQSDAQQYIAGSPIVLDAAYVIGGTLTDAELEALKEEYREKNAQLQQAIEDAEAAKAEWEQKAADLDGVAKESTSQDILTAVENIDIDLTPITDSIGTPAQGQSPTLFGAIGDVALSAQTLQSLADSWSAMVTHREDLDGYSFFNFTPSGVGDVLFKNDLIVEIIDNTVRSISLFGILGRMNSTFLPIIKKIVLNSCLEINGDDFFRFPTLEYFEAPNLITFGGSRNFEGCDNLRELRILNVVSLSASGQVYNCKNLILFEFGRGIVSNVNISYWNPTNALLSNSQTLLTPEDIAAGFTSNLEKLLYNIREHIAANLPMANLTIYFNAAVKSAILADQPTADAFTNKGWTIA